MKRLKPLNNKNNPSKKKSQFNKKLQLNQKNLLNRKNQLKNDKKAPLIKNDMHL